MSLFRSIHARYHGLSRLSRAAAIAIAVSSVFSTSVARAGSTEAPKIPSNAPARSTPPYSDAQIDIGLRAAGISPPAYAASATDAERFAELTQLRRDDAASRLSGSESAQLDVARRAAQIARASASASYSERERASVAAAMALSSARGPLLHTARLEAARRDLAEAALAVAQAQIANRDPDAFLGLRPVAAYFSDPSTTQFAPELSARLLLLNAAAMERSEREAAVQSSDDAAGRPSPNVVDFSESLHLRALSAAALRCAQSQASASDMAALSQFSETVASAA